VTSAGEIDEYARGRVMAELRDHFRPEFLNRVDEIVLFKPLTPSELERIVELQLEDVQRRLAERRIALEVGEEARRVIAEHGYDPVFGARPLRRYIQREVETRIARALLAGEISDGTTVSLDVGEDGLELRTESAEREPVGAAA
jgi:ATP-dependent Clp protease ATP-binding subunit ClpB